METTTATATSGLQHGGEENALGLRQPDVSPNELALRRDLAHQLRDGALQIGEVTLSSGQAAGYYIDAKRILLSAEGFATLGALVAAEAKKASASAVGGLSIGADAVACAAISRGAVSKAFFVRKQQKVHGLQRWIEGPQLLARDRCLIVDDVVTTGTSTLRAIQRLQEEGFDVVGVVSVVDRLAGGSGSIRKAIPNRPYVALTTIDDVYPERPDRP